MFLLSLINIAHSPKIFGKSLKINCKEKLCFSLGFLIFRYSQALQTSSQIQEEDEWRRQMISEEIRREEFDSQSQQYSPEEVSREVPLKKKNEHQKKNKKRSRTWGHDDTTTMMNFWSQHEVLFNVKHPNYLDKDCRSNALNRTAEALKEHGMDFSAEEISSLVFVFSFWGWN